MRLSGRSYMEEALELFRNLPSDDAGAQARCPAATGHISDD
jgi:hypothetical protein